MMRLPGTMLARGLCLLALTVTARAECKSALGVRDAVRNAQTLDGKPVCLHGMIVMTRGSTLVQELLPLPMKGRQVAKNRIGLVDWSPETGISEGQYRPESFDLLLAKEPGAPTEAGSRLSVTVRGVLMYKKNLRARVASVRPNSPEVRLMREARFEVELVLLEVVKSNVIR